MTESKDTNWGGYPDVGDVYDLSDAEAEAAEMWTEQDALMGYLKG